MGCKTLGDRSSYELYRSLFELRYSLQDDYVNQTNYQVIISTDFSKFEIFHLINHCVPNLNTQGFENVFITLPDPGNSNIENVYSLYYHKERILETSESHTRLTTVFSEFSDQHSKFIYKEGSHK